MKIIKLFLILAFGSFIFPLIFLCNFWKLIYQNKIKKYVYRGGAKRLLVDKVTIKLKMIFN